MHTRRAVHATFVFPYRHSSCLDRSAVVTHQHICVPTSLGWSCVLGSHTLCAHVGSAIVHIRRTAEAILYGLIDNKFSRRRN